MRTLPVLMLAAHAASAVGGLINCQRVPQASTPALNATCKLLVDNFNNFDVIFGPHNYDNHLAYGLIALYRMGASPDRLKEQYAAEAQELNPAIPSQHMINSQNWQKYSRQGLYYKDYTEFIRSEVQGQGLNKMLELYAPTALAGLTGGLLHPMIHLGYGFEMGDEEVISEGVGWLLSHGGSFPKLNPNPKYSYTEAGDILAAMRADSRLPTQQVSLSDLETSYADVVSEYDIRLPEGDTKVAIPFALEKAAMQVFGTGCDNFFLLHLSTGSRALSQILPNIADAEVRSAALQQLWKGVVYMYALEGRPDLVPPRAGPRRSWPDLLAAAMPIHDTHFLKMVYLCWSNYKIDGDDVWWNVAENVVTRFEHGGQWVFHPEATKDMVLFM